MTESTSCTNRNDAVAISVVVPVYNVEKYLRACLDSVTAQTLQDMEVILVDDGSTDGSPAIMAEYATADPRLKLVTKPNGGYGSAINAGIEAATGAYLGIVEPDDLVDPRMFEDLLAATRLPDGTNADIVKSSYWNYYDPEDGTPPYREPSSLMRHMPERGMVHTVFEHWNVLYHHPSIWSALYKRSFLDAKGIRMHEIPGAGWADNPWFYETILQAGSIVWLPRAYYCYRQTNAESSSYLKDFNLPFDRLADLYAIVERLDITDPHVLACLYHRTFGYIKSVLEKFGFPEKDEAVFARIGEALLRIDPQVLYTARTGIRKDHIAYYEHALGLRAQKVQPRKPVVEPAISIIVPLCNDRPFAWEFLDSCARQTDGSFEVICADVASQDLSRRIAQSFATHDKRVSVAPYSGESAAEAIAAALACARGRAVYIADAHYALPDDLVEKAHLSLDKHPDAALHLFCTEQADAAMLAAAAEGEGAPANASYILELAHPIASTCLYRRDVLRQAAEEHPDRIDCPALLLATLLAAKCPATSIGALALKKQSYRWVDNALAFVDPADAHRKECVGYLPRLQAAIEGMDDAALEKGWRGFAAKALCHDLDSLHRASTRADYLERLHAAFDCNGIIAGSPQGLLNIGSMNRLEQLLSNDALRVFEDRAIDEEQKYEKMRIKLQRIENLPLYGTARKAYKAGKAALGK